MQTMAEKIEVDYDFAVGATIRHIRRAKGLTQKQVADAANISQASLSSVENQHRAYSLNTLSRVAEALGVRLSTVISRAEKIATEDTEAKAMALLNDMKKMKR